MVNALAWAYVRYGSLPVAAGLLYGAKPVMIAIVLQALWRLGRLAVKTRLLGAIEWRSDSRSAEIHAVSEWATSTSVAYPICLLARFSNAR